MAAGKTHSRGKLRLIYFGPAFLSSARHELLRLHVGDVLRLVFESGSLHHAPFEQGNASVSDEGIDRLVTVATNHPETLHQPGIDTIQATVSDVELRRTVEDLLAPSIVDSRARRILQGRYANEIAPGTVVFDLPITSPGAWSIACQRTKDSAVTVIDFSVVPRLLFGTPQASCALTVHARCLGDQSDWEARILPWLKAGYNTIHLTPVSKHGTSAYSILDPLALDNHMSEEKLDDFVSFCHEHGAIVIQDLVLNHIACDSSYLARCPDAAYNTLNSPHLLAGLYLDLTLSQFSNSIAAGSFETSGLPRNICGFELTKEPGVETERSVDDYVATARSLPTPPGFHEREEEIMGVLSRLLRSVVLPVFRAREWLVWPHPETSGGVDIDAFVESSAVIDIVADPITDTGYIAYDGPALLPVGGLDVYRHLARDICSACRPKPAPQRCAGPEFAWDEITRLMLRALQPEHRPRATSEADVYLFQLRLRTFIREALFPIWNDELLPRELHDFEESVVSACVGHVRYERFNREGRLFRYPVSVDQPLFPRYYTLPQKWCDLYKAGLHPAVVNGEDVSQGYFTLPAGIYGFACNGWVMGGDPTSDFTVDGRVYFMRQLVAWSDCVKLRYFAPGSALASLTGYSSERAAALLGNADVVVAGLQNTGPPSLTNACPELW